MPDNSTFIVAAYAVTWITFVGYAIHLQRLRKTAAKQYDDASDHGPGDRT